MLEAEVRHIIYPSCWYDTPSRYSEYGETRVMIALEFFRNVMQAMSSKHSRENIVLKGLHKKKDLGDISQPEKTWFALAKEEVCT